MKVISRILAFVSCLILSMGLSLMPLDDAFAKEKGGGAHKTPGPPSRPPGWDKGKKEGWDSDVPPGLEGKWEPEVEGNNDKSKGEKKPEVGEVEAGDNSDTPGQSEGKGEKEGKVKRKEKGEKQKGKGKRKG